MLDAVRLTLQYQRTVLRSSLDMNLVILRANHHAFLGFFFIFYCNFSTLATIRLDP